MILDGKRELSRAVWLPRLAVCVSLIALALTANAHFAPTRAVALSAAFAPVQSHGCSLIKRTYQASAMEEAWLQNARSWAASYCDHIQQFQPRAKVWLDSIKAQSETANAPTDMDESIFSKFLSTYKCGNNVMTYSTWIEPLSHGLRHPDAICASPDIALGDRDFVFLSSVNETDYARGQKCIGRDCQNILVDLGASTWNTGSGGPSQSWFYEKYQKHGIELDRMLLWEATPHPGDDIFKELPPSIWHKYQYFNYPASADTSDPSSPLSIIKRIAQPGDFLVLKIDIDNFAVETQIVQELLADQGLIDLIDEFVHEEHVQFPPMLRYWGSTAHPNRTLYDSYMLFSQLRNSGIRAHSWV